MFNIMDFQKYSVAEALIDSDSSIEWLLCHQEVGAYNLSGQESRPHQIQAKSPSHSIQAIPHAPRGLELKITPEIQSQKDQSRFSFNQFKCVQSVHKEKVCHV